MDIAEIQKLMAAFAEDRDWGQFHNPKNLVMALSGEVGELTEIFQWLTADESAVVTERPEQRRRVEEEMADVLLYLARLADVLQIDLFDAAVRKVELNGQKYPVEKSKGHATKYTDLEGN